ncbi:hypothetical protein ACFX1Z_020659 [Malus domestica]
MAEIHLSTYAGEQNYRGRRKLQSLLHRFKQKLTKLEPLDRARVGDLGREQWFASAAQQGTQLTNPTPKKEIGFLNDEIALVASSGFTSQCAFWAERKMLTELGLRPSVYRWFNKTQPQNSFLSRYFCLEIFSPFS